jgi:hypothetical protein
MSWRGARHNPGEIEMNVVAPESIAKSLSPSSLSMHALRLEDGRVYITLSPELQRPIDGGCDCKWCKSHPDNTPAWDCLVIPAGDVPNQRGLITVHWPEIHAPEAKGKREFHGVKGEWIA